MNPPQKAETAMRWSKVAFVGAVSASIVLAACGSDTALDATSTTGAPSSDVEVTTTTISEVDGDAAEPSETTTATSSSEASETEGETEGETAETTADSTVEANGEEGAYTGSYTLDDAEFGTQVTVTVEGDSRTIVANALPDHETGQFPNAGNPNTISEQDVTYQYTTNPVFTGDATEARTTGVAVNGVKFEPGTAETVTCDNVTYRVEALQDVYNLGLDFNNAHVQPTGEYHYHGASELLADAYATEDDLVHVGFAADGFLMYYSKSGAYASGYELSSDLREGSNCVGSGPLGGDTVEVEGTTPDGVFTSDWVWSEANGDLDACNGIEIDGTYAYVVTDEFPYISRCLNGEVAGGRAGGPPPGA